MINFDDAVKENIKEHNPNWPQVLDHPYRILIVGGSGSGKTATIFDKIFLYAKDLYEEKYLFLIKKGEDVGTKPFTDSKAFIKHSNDLDDIYKNIEECNPNKKRKILIVFDDMVADMLNNIKINPIVTELFFRGRKLKISVFFITRSYLSVPKNIRLNSTLYFLMNVPNKQELQQIAFNHSSDIDFKDFINVYKKRYCKIIVFFS